MNKNNKILHLDSNIGIYYNHLHNWIYADWTNEQTSETIMQGCELILQFLKSEKCTNVLNDNTCMNSYWADASDWIATNWFPRMDEAGLKNFAWVYSPDPVCRQTAEQTISLQKSKSIIIPFEDLDTAKAWLKSV